MGHLAIHDALNAIDRRSQSVRRRLPREGARVRRAPRSPRRPTTPWCPPSRTSPAPFPQSCRRRRGGGRRGVLAQRQLGGLVPAGRAKSRGSAGGWSSGGRGRGRPVQATGPDTPLIVADYPAGHRRPASGASRRGRDFAFAPGWGSVTTVRPATARAFGSRGPTRCTSKAYARDLAEVKRWAVTVSPPRSRRTADQTADRAVLGKEPPAAVEPDRSASSPSDHHLDAWEQARLYGLLDVALADGYVRPSRPSTRDPFWRPVTAIQEADRDGNKADHGRPDVDSPRHHAADPRPRLRARGPGRCCRSRLPVVLRHRPDVLRPVQQHPPRGRWCDRRGAPTVTDSLLAGRPGERQDSRVYIGFHFRHATEVGLAHGDRIGRLVARSTLDSRAALTTAGAGLRRRGRAAHPGDWRGHPADGYLALKASRSLPNRPG